MRDAAPVDASVATTRLEDDRNRGPKCTLAPREPTPKSPRAGHDRTAPADIRRAPPQPRGARC